jgi:hypothetical protein
MRIKLMVLRTRSDGMFDMPLSHEKDRERSQKRRNRDKRYNVVQQNARVNRQLANRNGRRDPTVVRLSFPSFLIP